MEPRMNSRKQSANMCKDFGCDLQKHLFSAEDLEGTEDRVVYATESNSTFLECVPRSPQATTTWLVQRDDRKEEVRRSPVCLSVCGGDVTAVALRHGSERVKVANSGLIGTSESEHVNLACGTHIGQPCSMWFQ